MNFKIFEQTIFRPPCLVLRYMLAVFLLSIGNADSGNFSEHPGEFNKNTYKLNKENKKKLGHTIQFG